MHRRLFIVGLIGGSCYLLLRNHSPTHPQMSHYREPTEYRLPANDIPAEVRKRLHPWIAGFIGLTPEAASLRVAERWASIQRPSLRALRETLSQFKVEAIVDYGEGGRIRAFRPTDEEVGCGDFWYLPAPLSADEITERLSPSGLQGNDALHEFLVYYAGLSEDTTTAGHFMHDEPPWPLFSDSWDDSIEGFDEWKDSLMLYHARNGCHILVRRDGKVAWWIMQEGVVEHIADDFDSFIGQFNEHRKISWPYDPYGAPEDRH